MSLELASETLTTAGYAIGGVTPGDPGPTFVVAQERPGAGTPLPTGNSVDLVLKERAKIPACR
jgi:hypothetical protein